MSVKIRLRRMGSRGKPFYRMVVADSRAPREGRFIDILGYYNPLTDPPTIKIDEEKALLWLGRGAQPTDTAEALLKKESIFQKFLASKGVAVEEAPAAPKKRAKAAKEAPAAEAEVAVEAESEVAEVEQPTEEQG